MTTGLVRISHGYVESIGGSYTEWVTPEVARNINAARNRAAVWEAEARRQRKERDDELSGHRLGRPTEVDSC